MYSEFYGLSAPPFQLTPDHRFFFESSVHRKAVAHLMFGLSQGEGFIVVTGEVGAGKTTLVGHLLSTLDSRRFVAAKIVSSQLDGDDMTRMVASAFGLPQENLDKASVLTRIEQFLLRTYKQGQRTLLLIDEAQNLSIAALEELRMLSNFQVGPHAPLQSFLLGQPQFRRTLAGADLDQLRQRVIASYHLGPMGRQETAEYIHHRLRTVGWTGDPDLTDDCLAEIYRRTDGVPRGINTFCSRLLLFGFLEEMHRLDAETVRRVGEDLDRETAQVLDARPPGDNRKPPAAAGPTGAVLADLMGRMTSVEGSVRHHDRVIARALRAAADYFGGRP